MKKLVLKWEGPLITLRVCPAKTINPGGAAVESLLFHDQHSLGWNHHRQSSQDLGSKAIQTERHSHHSWEGKQQSLGNHCGVQRVPNCSFWFCEIPWSAASLKTAKTTKKKLNPKKLVTAALTVCVQFAAQVLAAYCQLIRTCAFKISLWGYLKMAHKP